MKLIISKDYDEMSELACRMYIDEINKNPEIVLGLATGSTPKGLYKRLIAEYKNNNIDFSKVVTFNLDEYIGLSEEDESSYRCFMNENLFNHINIKSENINIPNGKATDLEKFCEDYDRRIEESGGIDLMLLGLGEDGHIAFNEPGDYLNTCTNIANLAQSTIEVNSRFFESIDDVPKTAITMGMAGILKSKKIILMANGVNKHKPINALLNEKRVTTKLPVSFLRIHPNVTVIVDEKAYRGR